MVEGTALIRFQFVFDDSEADENMPEERFEELGRISDIQFAEMLDAFRSIEVIERLDVEDVDVEIW